MKTHSEISTLSLLLKALKFAAQKHQHQHRKGGLAIPYINHLIDVTDILLNIGQVEEAETLAAAALHDTLEDTKTTPEELEEMFGHHILSLVEEVTDDKRLPKEERKRLQIERAPRASFEAKQIKLADKISNVRDMIAAPPAGWSLQRRKEYVAWAEKVIEGVRGTNEPMERYFDEICQQVKVALENESTGE
ncbi:metal-dependent phosphohydrolase [Candidatus Moduliflexus flocculans]|uniref:Metal-dependent phosphohydrolase n=1 Tax=Candidatus Moduliflexus flocculans TaxID=1499966 RepID=A0A0S6W3W3_9BACT|nr:metal-dependent phosphohydrolase [Candidatus Moduliflexus flocculans]